MMTYNNTLLNYTTPNAFIALSILKITNIPNMPKLTPHTFGHNLT